MKKLFLLISILAFFTGCSNFFSDEVSIGLEITPHGFSNTRAVDSVTKLELWISNPGVDYRFVQEDKINSTIVFETEEGLLEDLEGGIVRYLQGAENSLSFDVKTNIPRVFSIRVEYASGRVFMGSKEQAVSPYVSNVQIDIYETAFSKQNSTFEDYNDFIKDEIQ